MVVQALKWIGGADGYLEIVDQRRLPGQFVKLQCRGAEQLFEAIKTLAVRGAPALGVAAAYGLVLGLQNLDTRHSMLDTLEHLKKIAEHLGSLRPTAVNLFWAIERVGKRAEGFVKANPKASLQSLRELVLAEAKNIYDEDVDMCRRIGENGASFVTQGAGVLTHCNAGALATAGQGTALSVIYEAHKKGKELTVYVDETRPLLQGARLTAWELQQAGINVTVICDNMAGWLMKLGKIDIIVTGADRIAANGDAANKIGTYGLSVLAKEHNIPFYIAAPSSTFDLKIKSGEQIPIEQRQADEVTTFAGSQIAPVGVGVFNPAFDVTPAKNITAIITERGVIEKPDSKKVAEHF